MIKFADIAADALFIKFKNDPNTPQYPAAGEKIIKAWLSSSFKYITAGLIFMSIVPQMEDILFSNTVLNIYGVCTIIIMWALNDLRIMPLSASSAFKKAS